MRTFKHLSLEEREVIYGGLKEGLSLRTIARELGRCHTTLARELQANSKSLLGNPNGTSKYLPCKAHAKALKRAVKQRSKAPLKEPTIFLYVREHLREDRWSPETIAGRLPLDHPGKTIDDETIYRYIYKGSMKRYKYWQYLTIRRKKRMKKYGRKIHRDGKIPGSISIDLRPKGVELRSTLGHWETDNVIGKITDRGALSVTVERMVRLTIISKLKNRTAAAKTEALVKRLMTFPEEARQTITTDNGKENSYHLQITKELKTPVFFCHAYHSWEKGTVENTNGRIRRYIKKGESIDVFSDEQIAAIEYILNNTPRKCLRFLTPCEKMIEVLQKT